MKTPPLDPLKDLTPVIQVASSPFLLMTRADSQVQDARRRRSPRRRPSPTPITYGTAGHGTFPQLAVELLMQNGNFKWVEVPYKGAAPAITDLLGGHVQLAALSVASGMPHIKGGKVRGLAVTSPTRSPALPDVPTVAESGFPGFDATGWLGIFVPNGTPPAVIARLNAEIAKVMQKPEVQQQLVAQRRRGALDPAPQEFGAMVQREAVEVAQDHARRGHQAGVTAALGKDGTENQEQSAAGVDDAVDPAGTVSPQRMILSARCSSASGRVTPIAWAVLRLTASSNRDGCSTGRSPGWAPLKMRSTYRAVSSAYWSVVGP